MIKEILAILFIFAILFVLPLNLYPASASTFASTEDEKYAIQINNLSCEITDYDIHLDLWHFSVAGSYTVTLNNSGDTDVSIRWNDGDDDTTTPKENEMVIPAKTAKKYSVNFSFHLLSRDFSYEYKGI
jgi:type 1 fimbria pilin